MIKCSAPYYHISFRLRWMGFEPMSLAYEASKEPLLYPAIITRDSRLPSSYSRRHPPSIHPSSENRSFWPRFSSSWENGFLTAAKQSFRLICLPMLVKATSSYNNSPNSLTEESPRWDLNPTLLAWKANVLTFRRRGVWRLIGRNSRNPC